MKQNYSIETVENGYVATFQSDLARKPETSVFLKFKDLEDFVISRLRWACKPEVEPNFLLITSRAYLLRSSTNTRTDPGTKTRIMGRELPASDEKCEECGAAPAWDFPWAGVFCAKCAGLDKSPAKKRRAAKRLHSASIPVRLLSISRPSVGP